MPIVSQIPPVYSYLTVGVGLMSPSATGRLIVSILAQQADVARSCLLGHRGGSFREHRPSPTATCTNGPSFWGGSAPPPATPPAPPQQFQKHNKNTTRRKSGRPRAPFYPAASGSPFPTSDHAPAGAQRCVPATRQDPSRRTEVFVSLAYHMHARAVPP